MKLEINIPTELSDITLRQYQKFLKTQEQVKSMTELQCIMIEIFCNLRPDMAKLMNFNQVEKITAELTAMFNDTPPLVQRFTMNGVEYGFIPELDDMTLGEYIDLDTYISDIDSLQVAMNVLYRPIVDKHKHKYTIKDYDPTTKNAMLNMPLDAVLSSMFFFLNLGMDLSITTLKYLTEDKETRQAAFHSSSQSMGGFTAFGRYLEGILQKSKILLN